MIFLAKPLRYQPRLRRIHNGLPVAIHRSSMKPRDILKLQTPLPEYPRDGVRPADGKLQMNIAYQRLLRNDRLAAHPSSSLPDHVPLYQAFGVVLGEGFKTPVDVYVSFLILIDILRHVDGNIRRAPMEYRSKLSQAEHFMKQIKKLGRSAIHTTHEDALKDFLEVMAPHIFPAWFVADLVKFSNENREKVQETLRQHMRW